jgi:hypothetical protein
MNTKQLRWIFLSLIATVLVGACVIPPVSVGFTYTIDDKGHHVSGGTNPVMICFALAFLLLYINTMLSDSPATGAPLPGIFRRFVAFYVDFIFAILTIAPIIGIVPMLIEWRTTREFAWTFARDRAASSDALVAPFTIVVTFAGLALWYALPLVFGRPTPEPLVLGYQIVSADTHPLTWPKAIKRVLLGFVATGAWFLAPFINRDKTNGQFWLDKVFKTRAVKLT